VAGILGWVLGDRSSATFKRLWTRVNAWNSYFYVTDGYSVYPGFINQEDHLVSKTYMTRVEGENSRLRHYLARLRRKTFCYSKSVEMLDLSIRLLVYYLEHRCLPLPGRSLGKDMAIA
jgi:IS1 family transposase